MKWILILILIFVRFSTIMTFMPIFSTRDLPMQAKVLFSGMMSFLFLLNGNYSVVENISSPNVFFLSILFEVINGLSVGMIVLFITNAIYVAGQIIDMNIGFSMVSVINPTGEDQMPITSNLYYIFLVIVFMLGNFHHHIIIAFTKYLEMTPLGVLSFNPVHINTYTMLMAETIQIGVMMSLPVLVTILVADIILGVLSKAMPGLNVFIIGMPFKIMVGLLTMVIVFPVLMEHLNRLLGRLLEYIYIVIGLV